MQIRVVQQDITTLAVDAIVNAANNSLLGGGGVDGAIHRKAGTSLLAACRVIHDEQGGCPTGKAVITPAGNLPAKYVIHTVGPVWHGGQSNESALLASCYTESLKLAEQNGFKTIAFPNISTGVYRFPKQQAAQIAVNTVKDFVKQNENHEFEDIIFVCFDAEDVGFLVNRKFYLFSIDSFENIKKGFCINRNRTF